ncbi:hypothetical protein MYX82_05080 [Acidobacteria bacterium AH-259-D05]|nr:hypothetical protein [Acidobacteria bacterium AH-259-D05]
MIDKVNPEIPGELLESSQTPWTAQRRKLQAWFGRNAPSLGELYEGAVSIVCEPEFPGRVRFVSHAVREIRNRLPDVVSGLRAPKRLDYKNRLDDIVKHWQKEGLPLDGSVPPVSVTAMDTPLSDCVPVRNRLFRRVSSLVKDHTDTREKPEQAAFRMFDALAPENEDLLNSLRPIILQWLEITNWFVRHAHDSGTQDKDFLWDDFVRRFELFETILVSLIREFFKTLEELDAILEEANS